MSIRSGGGGEIIFSTIPETKLAQVINFMHQISLIKKLHVSVRCVKLEI